MRRSKNLIFGIALCLAVSQNVRADVASTIFVISTSVTLGGTYGLFVSSSIGTAEGGTGSTGSWNGSLPASKQLLVKQLKEEADLFITTGEKSLYLEAAFSRLKEAGYDYDDEGLACLILRDLEELTVTNNVVGDLVGGGLISPEELQEEFPR